MSTVLGNLPMLEEFVVRWDFQLMRIAGDLNPEALKRPQGKNKVCSDREFMEAALSRDGKTFTNIVNEAKNTMDMSRRTVAVYLKRLLEKGLVRTGGGLYWVPEQ